MGAPWDQDEARLKELFRREDEIRRSPEIQAMYAQRDDLEWLGVVSRTAAQKALAEAGITEEGAIEKFRAARYANKEKPWMKECATFLKYDISRKGDLKPGDAVIDVPLVTLAGEPIYQQYKDRVSFVTIYISEAHAQDEWPMGDQVCFLQPKTLEARRAVAAKFVDKMKYQLPLFIDTMDNLFERSYAAWPERIYLATGAKIRYIGEPGPFGYKPQAAAAFLAKLLEQ